MPDTKAIAKIKAIIIEKQGLLRTQKRAVSHTEHEIKELQAAIKPDAPVKTPTNKKIKPAKK